eukprot:TRINITY_DN43213_c0_g1_i1.p2 TRINITY_DN43213_c0_g1~~TRINITY_DN43213_c0_g1_i1.p2  ORF type:complete len:579 (-),score=102.30 TRINITY_DN43213_c0_g1_i1:283-2019(-)
MRLEIESNHGANLQIHPIELLLRWQSHCSHSARQDQREHGHEALHPSPYSALWYQRRVRGGMKGFMAVLALVLPCTVTAVALPTQKQLDWMDLEVGAMIGFNLQSHCLATSDPGRSGQPCLSFGAATGSDPSAMQQGARRGWLPTLETVQRWKPTDLDTDKWAQVAKSFGAKYVVLVADHMSGFALWNTAQHNYSMASSLYKGGGGDVVADLVASCRSAGLEIGFFYSVHFNWWLGVHDFQVGHPRIDPTLPNLTQADYLSAAKAQLTELVSRFGEEGPFEIWFDGGTGPSAPVIGEHLRRIAPNAVCHSCYPNFTSAGTIRWMGNEDAMMPLPSWAASSPDLAEGNPHGEIFAPPSSDAVMREHYWFWANTSTGAAMGLTDSPHHLVRKYLTSVGRSSNLILNMAPDGRTGAVAPSDVTGYQAMDDALVCLFRDQVAQTGSGDHLTMQQDGKIIWRLDGSITSNNVSIVLREDQTHGQLVGNYSLFCSHSSSQPDSRTEPHCEMGNLPGVIPSYQYPDQRLQTGIGHKRILMIAQKTGESFDTITLHVYSHFAGGSLVQPSLRDIRIFDWTNTTDCY